jgi:hypothetical protein
VYQTGFWRQLTSGPTTGVEECSEHEHSEKTMDVHFDQFSEDPGAHVSAGERFTDEEPVCPSCEDFGCGGCIHMEDDEPHDHLLAQQELEDFEQADEYFGFCGDDTGD